MGVDFEILVLKESATDHILENSPVYDNPNIGIALGHQHKYRIWGPYELEGQGGVYMTYGALERMRRYLEKNCLDNSKTIAERIGFEIFHSLQDNEGVISRESAHYIYKYLQNITPSFNEPDPEKFYKIDADIDDFDSRNFCLHSLLNEQFIKFIKTVPSEDREKYYQRRSTLVSFLGLRSLFKIVAQTPNLIIQYG